MRGALYSSCAIWSERIVGHARQNFSIAQTCIRAARAIWTKDRKPLAVARADYLWATCLHVAASTAPPVSGYEEVLIFWRPV